MSDEMLEIEQIHLFTRHMDSLFDGDWIKAGISALSGVLSSVLYAISSLLYVDIALVVGVMLMILIDLITRLRALRKNGQHPSPWKLKQTIRKVVVYSLFIAAGAIPDNLMGLHGWLIRPLAFFLIYTEFKSITVNLFGEESDAWSWVKDRFRK